MVTPTRSGANASSGTTSKDLPVVRELPAVELLRWTPPGELLVRESAYWRSRFPCSPERLARSRLALKRLREAYPQEGDGFYPWRLKLSPATGLPAFLRKRDAVQFPPEDGKPREAAWGLLRDTLGPTLFGAEELEVVEFVAGPVIKLGAGQDMDEPASSRHFTWRQYFGGLPVIGGSARVHEVIGDPRVSVTSSFFPVADEPPDLSQEIAEDLLIWRALLAAIMTLPGPKRPPFVLALIQQFMSRWRRGDLSQLERLLSPLLGDGLSRRALKILGGLAGRLTPMERLLMTWGPRLWRLLQLDRRAVSAKPVPIYDMLRAILPFDGAYHLICRVQLSPPADDPWYVDVDVVTGQTLGEPWQMVAHAPKYYRNSSEAIPAGGHPTGNPNGNTSDVPLSDLGDYVGGLPLASLADSSVNIETTTVAIHARLLLNHLLDVCGLQQDPAQLKSYALATPPAGQQTPGAAAQIGDGLRTGFAYDAEVNPKAIRFQKSDGLAGGALQAVAPGRDPEVIMHEFVHGFLWLLDSEPWDTPPSLNPFGRALHEGYAMYLSRSLAAGDGATAESGNPDHLWARAAYPKATWDLRWAFERLSHQSGADYLPAPNSYPSGSYSVEDTRVYDVGMVWARALWDLRQLVGPGQADWLAVQAYPYLHGYIANFELAAEGMLDVDIRCRPAINLANGTQPLWVNRGIAAGQGVHGFAQGWNSTTLIAGTDAGILVSNDNGGLWIPDTDSLAGGGMLTGVVAVAAAPDQEVLYAAAQMPVSDAAGDHTQWAPGVYQKNLSQPTPVWQPVGAWPNTETPLCLAALNGGGLVAGTTRGAQKWPGTAATWAPDQDGIQAHAVLDIASAGTHLWGCAPAWIVRRSLSTSASTLPWQAWNFRQSGGGSENIVTCITIWNSRVYVGTLAGAWLLKPNGHPDRQLPDITEPVLALAATAAGLCLAVGSKIYRYNGASTPAMSLLGELPTGATICSLFVTVNNTLLAGTLAHGIWRKATTDAGWQKASMPPSVEQLILEPNERALWSFVQSESLAVSYAIELIGVGDVALSQVAQPGFPLQIVEPVSGSYTLKPGPVILVLENTSSSTAVQLRLVVSAPAVGMATAKVTLSRV